MCAVGVALHSSATPISEADGILAPYIGRSFAQSDTKQITTFGASLAAISGGIFGFEIDYARTVEAPPDTAFVSGEPCDDIARKPCR